MTTSPKASPLDVFRRLLADWVATGYESREDLIDRASDYLADLEDDEADGAEIAPKILVEREVDTAIQTQIEAQKAWPTVTDCDRLDAAFAELERGGIVARQNFTCCQNCGFAEIGAEIDDVKAAGHDVSGFVFFHQQDSEAAAGGYGIHLSYATLQEGKAPAVEAAATAMVREVIGTLERHGLKPDWDGTLAKRVHVPLDWKRRFPGSPPPPARRDIWAWLGIKRDN